MAAGLYLGRQRQAVLARCLSMGRFAPTTPHEAKMCEALAEGGMLRRVGPSLFEPTRRAIGWAARQIDGSTFGWFRAFLKGEISEHALGSDSRYRLNSAGLMRGSSVSDAGFAVGAIQW